jgi:sterol desaturase/sphingolipid hydroxylase (fatty acid hydroxylase superfamily)
VSGDAAIWAAIQGAVAEAFKPGSAYGAPALGGALAVCAFYYTGRRRARGRTTSVKGFVRSIFPKRVLLHPSSLVDMRLWALNGVAFASAYAMLGFSLFFWRDTIVADLTAGWGPRPPVRWPAWTILALATLLQLLASELAYWFAHYCFHKVPALWEFHKVHHSAEVMTTLTELRQHPVEIIAFINLIGLSTGIVFGVMTYAFGPGVRPFTLLNGNILLMAFLVTYGHLRHSHMWIAFTGLAGRILQSPAHHQLHHSANPAHYDRNLGFALAVWDWAFGTLLIPGRRREPIMFGVGAEAPPFPSALAALITPCARFAGRTLMFVRRCAGAGGTASAARSPFVVASRRASKGARP